MPKGYKTIEGTANLGGNGDGLYEFDTKVSEAMENGWTPHGSLVTTSSSSGFTRLLQPMIKTVYEGYPL